jgi:hypothetical protein
MWRQVTEGHMELVGEDVKEDHVFQDRCYEKEGWSVKSQFNCRGVVRSGRVLGHVAGGIVACLVIVLQITNEWTITYQLQWDEWAPTDQLPF